MYLYGFVIQQSVAHCLPHDYRVWWVTGPLALVLSAVVAYLSWTLLEKKVLEHKSSILRAVNRAVSGFQAARVALFLDNKPKR
jgi:peptidoglycan/LPS O-acetylase OafA/YrhL